MHIKNVQILDKLAQKLTRGIAPQLDKFGQDLRFIDMEVKPLKNYIDKYHYGRE
jgi:hypothetical protein